MDTTPVIDAVQTLLLGATQIIAPAIIVILIVTVIVAIGMAMTQLQEQTLSFIPKLIVLFLIVYYGGSGIIDSMVTLFVNHLKSIPTML